MYGCPGCGGALDFRGQRCLCGMGPELDRSAGERHDRRLVFGCPDCGGAIESRGDRCQCAAGRRTDPDVAVMQLEAKRNPLWGNCGGCGAPLMRGAECGCTGNLSGAEAAQALRGRRMPPGETLTWEEAMAELRRRFLWQ